MIYNDDTYTFYEDNPVYIIDKDMVKDKKREKHFHSFYQVFYLVRGKIKLKVNNIEYLFCKGEFFFINKYELHEYMVIEESYLVVYNFDRYYIQENMPEFDTVRIECNSIGKKEDEKIAWVKGVLDGMYKEYHKDTVYHAMGMKSYLFFLCYNLITNFKSEPMLTHIRLMPKGYHRQLYKILEYMHNHYLEPLKLKDVADHFGLTAEYVAKLFKKYFDSTFKKYLDEFKLEKAYSAVTQTDELIVTIAYEYGFSSQKSFIRIFKNRFNSTPTQLRNTIRNDQKS